MATKIISTPKETPIAIPTMCLVSSPFLYSALLKHLQFAFALQFFQILFVQPCNKKASEASEQYSGGILNPSGGVFQYDS